MVTGNTNNLEVFAIGRDSVLYHNYLDEDDGMVGHLTSIRLHGNICGGPWQHVFSVHFREAIYPTWRVDAKRVDGKSVDPSTR